MTGACRPTPPACIYTALEENPGDGWTDYADVARVAQAVWDALLAEGRIITTQRGFPTIYESGLFISLPLVADKEENNDKEDYEGGVNWP